MGTSKVKNVNSWSEFFIWKLLLLPNSNSGIDKVAMMKKTFPWHYVLVYYRAMKIISYYSSIVDKSTMEEWNYSKSFPVVGIQFGKILNDYIINSSTIREYNFVMETILVKSFTQAHVRAYSS